MDQTQRESARRRTAELAAARYRMMPAWVNAGPSLSPRSKKPKPVAASGYERYLAAKHGQVVDQAETTALSPDSPF